MSVVKGRGIRVEFANAYAAAKTISAVSQANPGQATSTSHGLADGTVGYFSGVSGMVQLEGQAGRVDNTAANTFDIQGLNTTNFSAFTGTCSFTPVSTWHSLAEATGYTIGGGEAEKLDSTTLIDVVKQEEAGLLAPQTLSINILAQETPSTALAALQALAQAGTKVVFRITLANGAVRIGYGEPSLPGEDVQRGQLGTGTFSFTVKGLILLLA